LTAITMVSAPRAADTLSEVVWTPNSRASDSLRAGRGSATVIEAASTPPARSAPHQAGRHVSAAKESDPHRRSSGLGPNTAVPTRTIVAPSAIAASRSPLMPIDRVSSL
jgi:hypothetical protein